MTMRELAEWLAYYDSNPFGPERGDLQAGIITSMVANVNSKKKYTASDFMPNFKKEKPQTMEEMKQVVEQWKGIAEAAQKAKNNG